MNNVLNDGKRNMTAVYRPNVGIVLLNKHKQVFIGKRIGKLTWQFPQGGIHAGEAPLAALYRELHEEVGLHEDDVELIAEIDKEFQYLFQTPMVKDNGQRYDGQSQRWFLLQLISHEKAINLAATTDPEFDAWKWVDYWYPLEVIVDFKRAVYQQVLDHFASYVTAC